MRIRLKEIWNSFIFFFPIQLLFLHIKKHIFLSVIWLLLFMIVLQQFGNNYGIPSLLLDPEFHGKVNFLSFYVVGIAMGGFIMTWNVCLYILDACKFEFLLCVSKPFVRFIYNNTLIPFAFSIIYIIQIYHFQHHHGLQSPSYVLMNILGLILGNLSMIFLYSMYFILFTEDVKTFIENLSEKSRIRLESQNINFNLFELKRENTETLQWKVDSYWHYPWKINKVNSKLTYDDKLINEVFTLHHKNIFVIILISFVSLLLLGILMDYFDFLIPAGATIFLLVTVIFILITFSLFWFKEWILIAFISILLILNILTKYDYVVYHHRLYGLNYAKSKDYNHNTLEEQTTWQHIQEDRNSTFSILNNWKKKNNDVAKPKLIILNIGGGGSKAAYWTFHVLQELNIETNQKFFKRTSLISGASGGMYGAAYYRELYLRQLNNKDSINLFDTKYLNNIGKDMLNAATASIATNDIFYPFRKFNYGGFIYNKDRAYFFDRQFNENTGYILDKKLIDYATPERIAKIPMMVIASTIIDDQRMLYFSPQPISYLLRPYLSSNDAISQFIMTDALDFRTFFKEMNADSVSFISSLRTNATYPYILPSVYLPTHPRIKAMDSGFRDNYGYIVTARYISTFKEWIEQNTSGVIVVTIRVQEKRKSHEDEEHRTYLGELFSPIGGIYSNMINLQNYNSDQYFATIENAYRTNINFIDFVYQPSKKNEVAALSWHLTEKEKVDIKTSFTNSYNQEMRARLLKLLY